MTEVPVYGLRGRTDQGPATGGLVAGRVETTSPYSGLRLIEDVDQIREAIDNKDWLSGSLAGVAGVADAVALAFDPIGSAVAMGVGWILDHISPLKEWLNQLTGDAGAVAGGAASWENIARHLRGTVEELRDAQRRLEEQQSQTTDAAKQIYRDVTEHLEATAGLAQGISTGLTVASSIVQMVHDLVRDAIGDLVGQAISGLVTVAATAALGTPKVIADIVTKAAKWAARLSEKVTALVRSFKNLSGLMGRVKGVMGRINSALDKTATGRAIRHGADKLGTYVTPARNYGDVSHPVWALGAFRGFWPWEYIPPIHDPQAVRPFRYPTAHSSDVNPRYSEGSAFQMNCMDCSRSFEMTWRGTRHEAAGRTFGDGEYPIRLEQWSGDNMWSTTPSSLEGSLKASGHGASAIVITSYEVGGKPYAHAYNVVNHQGSILMMDAQSNQLRPIDPRSLHFGLPNTYEHLAIAWGPDGHAIGPWPGARP